MLLYFLIVALCSLACFHVYVRHGKYGRAIGKMRGPPALPIFGNMLSLNCGPVEFWNYLADAIKIYYPCGRIWFFTCAVVITQDPDDLRILLTDKTNITKGFVYEYFHLMAKTGLITSTGEKWQYRRKILTPAFHTHIIKKYMKITFEQGERFVKSIKAQGDETVQSLIPVCSDLTLSIILEAAMGIQFQTIGNKAEEYRKAIEHYFSSIAYRATRPYIKDWMLRYFSEGRRILATVKVLREFTDKIIDERREYHKQTKQESFQKYVDDDMEHECTDGEGRKKRLAMLDLLLMAEKEGLIDEEGIKEEVDTFTAAGYDTTGMEMVYLLMLMAENKDQQELARAEANRILDASGGKISMKEINQMEYIERCVKESLRLFPTAPHIVRAVTEDIQLKNYMVPAGTDIFVPIHILHRDPKYWSDPLKFDPDRFLPGEAEKRYPFTYLPFSHGPRNCIGQKFAIAELKSLLACVLRNFYLEPVSYTKDLQFTLHVVLLPTVRPHIKFISIKKND
ncbi:cytochrome P450 4AB14 precursor [Nasonia vitripennis]|uniref:Cytochrome P450 n=1 Tax=Nasonia vitripennis TaxID=7425 RepID=A0A7M6UP63_NASVI|nr:cytochrome P450 4AB14 precursor [Nasonia vitripennis]